MIQVGQKVQFDPYYFVTGYGAELVRGNMIAGTVAMVNEKHKWFSVEYGDPTQRTSFKFCDLGERVKVIG